MPTDRRWVTQAAYSQLDNAIVRATAVRTNAASSPAQLDYQSYLLYLTLSGSRNDIGACFGGLDYAGFDNAISAGSLPP